MRHETGNSAEPLTDRVGYGLNKANDYTVNITFDIPEHQRRVQFGERLRKGVGKLALITTGLFLGVGMPVTFGVYQQSNKVISDGINPAQADLNKQLSSAKDELKKQMHEDFNNAEQQVKEDMNHKIDEEIDKIFQNHGVPPTTVDQQQQNPEAASTSTTSTSVVDQP
jgi:hypothetical protein